MKKLLTMVMVILMARTAFAFVPLSNAENIGSYQRGATRGMFYNELDIISAAPVELLDFSGNALYTNWGNIRNFNDIVNYNQLLRFGSTSDITDTSYFTFGVTGNPTNNDKSRSGIIYQNFGGKTSTKNLDLVNGNESEGIWSTNAYTIVYPTAPVIDRAATTNSDTKYFTNRFVTQWNLGSAYKLMDKLSIGLSLYRNSDSTILTSEGSKSYGIRYLTANGAVNDGGRPATATESITYTFTYPDQEIDQNSSATTDVLPQARLNIADDLYVDAGIGLRFSNATNGADVFKGNVSWEQNVVTATSREDILVSTAAGGLATNQRFNTGTAILIKSGGAGNYNVDMDQTNLTTNTNLASDIYNTNNWTHDDKGLADFSDDRTGTGVLLRLEAKKKFAKYDVTGLVNFSSVPQDIDATATSSEYVKTTHILYAGTTSDTADSFIERDLAQAVSFKGTATNSNLDLGVKVEMKALEGLKLALAGYIQRGSVKTDLDTTSDTSETTTYDDGLAAISSGTVGGTTPAQILANRPGPVDGSISETNVYITGRGDIGMSIAGNGEGSWLQTTSQTGTRLTEVVTTNFGVPVGVEIPLSKKFTFRAGTEYILTKTQTTSETTTVATSRTTTATPTGETAKTRTDSTTNAQTDESITNAESHSVYYSYGLQFDATPSLTVAINAFLDTSSDVFGANASIFDLSTYRNLSLSATVKF